MKQILLMIAVVVVGCGKKEPELRSEKVITPDEAANELFVEAVELVNEAESREATNVASAIEKYEQALTKLQTILDKYKKSDLAVNLISGETLFTGKSLRQIRERVVELEQMVAEAKADKAATPDFDSSGMAWIPPGTFRMGWADGPADETPVHPVKLDGFWMGVHEVTNDEYAKFVASTKYVTLAEQVPTAESLGISPEQFANIPKDKIVAGSIVFTPPAQDIPVNKLKEHNMWGMWWRYVGGTNWRHPERPESSIAKLGNHPVVHINWDDARAYCAWLTANTGVKHRLPTEAEWEYAARGGLEGMEYVWGEKQQPGNKPLANIWQGRFPRENTQEDGFYGTAPVGAFPDNGYGLHDMAGNVWEWCADWYAPGYYGDSPVKNPRGPLQQDSFDHNDGRNRIPKRIQRGGSFLCTDLYCGAFRPSRRMKNTPDSGSQHAGFRVVAEGAAPVK